MGWAYRLRRGQALHRNQQSGGVEAGRHAPVDAARVVVDHPGGRAYVVIRAVLMIVPSFVQTRGGGDGGARRTACRKDTVHERLRVLRSAECDGSAARIRGGAVAARADTRGKRRGLLGVPELQHLEAAMPPAP